MGSPTKSVDVLKGPQKGLWHLFENLFVISWVCSANDVEGRQQVHNDISAIQQSLLPLLRKHYVVLEKDVTWSINEGKVGFGEESLDKWRALLGTCLLKLEEPSIVVD